MSSHILSSLRNKLVTTNGGLLVEIQKRCLSYDEVVKKRNELFDYEQKRQREEVGRVEKIEVRYLGLPQDETLVMNKNLSTPYNVAQHLSENICNQAVLGLVNANIQWDIHRPLEESCTLQLLNFTTHNPTAVNRAFWRSCSFMLGAVLQRSFKESAGLYLHSFPKPSVKSGSFIHDFSLINKNWTPSILELKAISIAMRKFATENHRFERLCVSQELALEMFQENHFKREQLPSISKQNNGKITLYRAGEHIDISGGPMIANTSFINKILIAAVHKISSDEDKYNLYRIQGISIPHGIRMSYYAFNTVLGDRAKKLNPARLPDEVTQNSEKNDDHQRPQISHENEQVSNTELRYQHAN